VPRRISDQTASVLRLFLNRPKTEFFGLEILKDAGLASGSLYPILHRLEERGILESRWEPLEDAVASSRRPRRLYRLNPGGATRAEHDLAAWERARRARREGLRARTA
jgi:PadR family transcriptional regulator PadR